MIKVYSHETNHPSAIKRIGSGLEKYDILPVKNPDTADIIVAALVEELKPFISHYRNRKGYLLWCDEPLWSNIFEKVDTSEHRLYADGEEVTIDVMNCFTGDVHLTNSHFLTEEFLLSPEMISDRLIKVRSSNQPMSRKIVTVMSRRVGSRWNYNSIRDIFSLNHKRIEIAELGIIHGMIKAYGDGWPDKTQTTVRDRDSKHVFSEKIDIICQYSFNLCFENTHSRFYVTEKIWHAIVAGSLPIYYAGPKHTIYQDLPKDSFVDYSDFTSPYELFEFINTLSESEYRRRVKLCQESLLALAQINAGKRAEDIQVFSTASRIKGIHHRLFTKEAN